MSDEYGYLNARVRARRSQLLPEGFFREALSLNFSQLVKILGESVYGPDLTGNSVSDIDRAVSLHLSRTVTDLPRLVSGEAREAVRLLLLRADLANVRTILRGKGLGWSAGEITGHLGGGTFPQSLYSAMAEAPDLPSLAQVLSLLDHPLAKILREASKVGSEAAEIEISLEHVFFREMLHQAEELDHRFVVNFTRFEIDASNLASGVKLFIVGFKGPMNRFFLKGGRRVSVSLFHRLATGDTAALQELSNTDFARVAEVRDLRTLEQGLGCVLLAKAREGALDVLGPGLANDYIRRKEWEACRIRLLARRAYYNLPPASVEREVFC